MYKYSFFGKIYPERFSFTIGLPTPLKIKESFFGIDEEVKIYFNQSLITVEMESKIDYNNYEKCNFETLGFFIEETIRAIIDIYCYINSFFYEVDLIKMVCPELKIDFI